MQIKISPAAHFLVMKSDFLRIISTQMSLHARERGLLSVDKKSCLKELQTGFIHCTVESSLSRIMLCKTLHNFYLGWYKTTYKYSITFFTFRSLSHLNKIIEKEWEREQDNRSEDLSNSVKQQWSNRYHRIENQVIYYYYFCGRTTFPYTCIVLLVCTL
jgi:hypothetical protein